jgi:hypothetical protein
MRGQQCVHPLSEDDVVLAIGAPDHESWFAPRWARIPSSRDPEAALRIPGDANSARVVNRILAEANLVTDLKAEGEMQGSAALYQGSHPGAIEMRDCFDVLVVSLIWIKIAARPCYGLADTPFYARRALILQSWQPRAS